MTYATYLTSNLKISSICGKISQDSERYIYKKFFKNQLQTKPTRSFSFLNDDFLKFSINLTQ